MKTGKSKSRTEVAVFKDTNTTVKPVKKLTPPIKTESSYDKENFGKQCRVPIPITGGTIKSKLNGKEELKEKLNRKITAEDLTSEEGPSEIYWETLAEKRRKALEETLTENSHLHEKIELLVKENETLKQALADATEIVDFLNEIVEEHEAEEREAKNNESSEDIQNEHVRGSPKPVDDAFGNDSTIYSDSDNE